MKKGETRERMEGQRKRGREGGTHGARLLAEPGQISQRENLTNTLHHQKGRLKTNCAQVKDPCVQVKEPIEGERAARRQETEVKVQREEAKSFTRQRKTPQQIAVKRSSQKEQLPGAKSSFTIERAEWATKVSLKGETKE